MSEWTIQTLKDHFDELLNERINTIRESDKAFSEAIEKIEVRLNEIPQSYAQKSEYNTLRDEINFIKSDHVQRRELNEIKDQQSQGRGIRMAGAAAIGIIITLITVTLGVMYSNQIKHSDISAQITRESPWLEDRPTIEDRLDSLERQIIALNSKLVQHEAEDEIRAAK